MNSIDATEAKNRFGFLLQEAISGPVGIRKNGRITSVMMSIKEFERLSALEDAFWGEKAREAEAEGFLSSEESFAFIQETRNETTANHF